MKKTQLIRLEFDKVDKQQPPFYCPFSGVKILHEDPFYDAEQTKYPDSVAAIWMTGDFTMFNYPLFQNPKFTVDLESYEDVESFEDCIELIEKTKVLPEFLAFQLNYYGSHPGDFGVVYILFFVPKN